AQIDRNESFPQAHNEYSSFARAMLMLISKKELKLSQKRFRQAAIHGDQVTGSATRLWSCQKEDCRSAILRVDRLTGEGALRIKLRQLTAQVFVRSSGVKRDSILRKRSDDSVAGKHGRTFHHGGRTNAIHTDLGRQSNRQLTHQMTHCGLADVVRFAAAL